MGFGWTPEPEAARKYAPGRGSSRDGLDADAGADAGTDADAGPDTDGDAAREEGDGGRGGGPSARSAATRSAAARSRTARSWAARARAARRVLGVVLPLSFLGALAGPAAPEAHALPAAAGDAGAPPAANTPATITTSRFTPEGFTFAGTEKVRTAKGPLKVIVLRMKAASLTRYRLWTREPGTSQQRFAAEDLELRGNVKLYMRKFSGCLEGVVCLSFSPESLPAPPVVPPFVYMTRVKAEQALVTTDELTADGLDTATRARGPGDSTGIGDGDGDGDGEYVDVDGRTGKGGKKGSTGGSGDGEQAPDGGESGPGAGAGAGEPGVPSAPPRPGMPAATDPRREPSHVPWCEKVSLTFENNGREQVTEGTVVFTSRVVGALGVPWVTETSRRKVPDVAPGESVRKTWRVCVDGSHASKFLLGRHLEHEAKVTYPGGELKSLAIPYP
jgi:hypothetical protein